MECTLLRESVQMNQTIYEASSELPVDAELTLPDYCPDVGKILKCRAIPRVTSRILRGETLTVEGVTRIVVLYCDARQGTVSCYEHELPFAANRKIADASDNARIKAVVRTEYINCRAVSQRKLDIHGAFTVDVTVSAPGKCEMVCGVEGAGVKVRKADYDVSTLVCAAQSSFTVSEALEVGSDSASIGSVVRNDANIRIIEYKAIANKLVVKGEAVLTLVYCGESGEGVQTLESVIGFNEFIDVPGVDDTCMIDISIESTGVDIGLRTDANGEYRRMNVDVHAFVDAKAYREKTVSVVCDAYSVEYEVELDRRQLTLERYFGEVRDTAVCQQVLDTGDISFASVDDVRCQVQNISAKVRDGRLEFDGELNAGVLGRNTDGVCVFCEKMVPFTADTQLPFEVRVPRYNVSAAVTGCSYIITGSGRPEIRANIAMSAAVYDEMSVSSVCAVTADENRRKQADDASVIMYCAQAGEELWDIAREHNSSVEAIKADNDIDCDTLEDGRMLLISVS